MFCHISYDCLDTLPWSGGQHNDAVGGRDSKFRSAVDASTGVFQDGGKAAGGGKGLSRSMGDKLPRPLEPHGPLYDVSDTTRCRTRSLPASAGCLSPMQEPCWKREESSAKRRHDKPRFVTVVVVVVVFDSNHSIFLGGRWSTLLHTCSNGGL